MDAVTGPSLSVSLSAPTVSSRSRDISDSLSCLGALVTIVCPAITGLGYAVVSLGPAVTILSGPVAVLGGLVGLGGIAIPGIASRIIVHAADDTP